ncbi:sensory box/GGDEF/EAL family protein [Sulfurimonas gotlandica GD1]|uniref:Sensory box/GGDEF/EAL family protein n=1 Tax=Sulfurimonas gotlandica (strain DSM 19862 / JCM 16533 / GD1) TaxID=929558 RepID=B6BHM3_SULGG|nr:bifunctional diguanylate cyclase/phosphodiesterase [Sulfurimonas gotlandica]EDZ62991.1 sensory box sensor/ggdef/eal domain protein [Sulfurimonas gotlandica GD1]EHP30021.1 sensory box/GGDEF/EAL family protein [Sulfurimonas gotlandica GD1]
MLKTFKRFLNFPKIPDTAIAEFMDYNIEADKLMLRVFVFQWFIATFITSILYDTYLYGFISGGLVTLMMFITYKYYKGRHTMMILSSIAMMLFSLIFIQQHLGRIEMHFHVFIGLAILTIYKDIIPITIGAITTIIHHFFYNYLQTNNVSIFDTPIMIFNYGCSYDIVILHGVFVIFELIVLGYIVKKQVKHTVDLITTKKDLEYISMHDTLTNLPNRHSLNTKIEYITSNANRHKTKFAVIFLDLDYFKNINDTLGHDVGDELLKAVAKKLTSSVRENDIVSRIGGDEFIIIAVDIMSENDILEIVKNILNIFREDIIVSGNTLRLSASLGISIYPDDSINFIELMKFSDIAMYKAKEQGRDNFNFFKPKLDVDIHYEVEIINDLQKALDNNEFKLYYQPKVDAISGKIIGAEGLIRWEHPSKGIIPPNEFIPFAENTGFILKIGEFVINEGIKYISKLNLHGYDNIHVSINISNRQFQHSDIYNQVNSALKVHMVKGKQLALEITESLLVDNVEDTIEKLHKIKKLNVKICMDDFGTGYSSLSYLKLFPIDSLKIDKSFVDDIKDNSNNERILLNTIIAMGQTLGLDVIAEGIEEGYQLRYLQSKNCQYYQGYYFSKAVTEDEFIALLKNQ